MGGWHPPPHHTLNGLNLAVSSALHRKARLSSLPLQFVLGYLKHSRYRAGPVLCRVVPDKRSLILLPGIPITTAVVRLVLINQFRMKSSHFATTALSKYICFASCFVFLFFNEINCFPLYSKQPPEKCTGFQLWKKFSSTPFAS